MEIFSSLPRERGGCSGSWSKAALSHTCQQRQRTESPGPPAPGVPGSAARTAAAPGGFRLSRSGAHPGGSRLSRSGAHPGGSRLSCSGAHPGGSHLSHSLELIPAGPACLTPRSSNLSELPQQSGKGKKLHSLQAPFPKDLTIVQFFEVLWLFHSADTK